MKKNLLLTILLLSAMFAMAQSITVKFTAEDQNGNYFQLDAVKVTSISQNWNQTLAYPDTILILNYTDGIAELPVAEGLLQNRPNPFRGTTEATLTLQEEGQAKIQVIDIAGKVLAECAKTLTQGEHIIKVSLAEPQMALLRVSTPNHDYAVKMLNVAHGGTNSIDVSSVIKREVKQTRAVGAGPFSLGDVLSYTGVKMQGADMVLSNNTVTHAQYSDEVVTFVFDVETPQEPELPIVVTSDVSDITSTTAVCGGEVISDGGAEVTSRGVCWATTTNPTTSDSHTTDGSGLGEFVSNLTNLTAGTTYYVRAYAINSVGTAYGESKSFTPEASIPEGAINGLFSVSETKQVYFSKGNLQYQASTNTWRFAENQWDFVGGNDGQFHYFGNCGGSTNNLISESYDGWIDLFGWGTSGYDHGAVCYQPWSINRNSENYYAYGSVAYNLYDQTGKADWGYNAIINGGNHEGLWRTLTKEEWQYLLFERNTASHIRFAKGIVNGYNGIIVLPDSWNANNFPLGNVNTNDAPWASNIISESDWQNSLQAYGAVFLITGGYREGAVGSTQFYVYHGNIDGVYWSASIWPGQNSQASSLWFTEGYVYIANFATYRESGRSVRLVKDY